MIARSHRFHGYNSLRHVYRDGRVVRSQFYAVKYIPNPRRETYRVAVVVSRKIHKSAVSRNRMRRKVYSVVRELSDSILGPYDIVITVFQDSLLNLEEVTLRRQLKQKFKEAGIIK